MIQKSPDATMREELQKWVNERVAARYWRISVVAILPDFPRSVAGKTLKRKLREQYLRESGRAI